MKEQSKVLTIEQQKEFIKILRKYILNRLPTDFYYLGKDNFNKIINKRQKKLRN